MQSLDKVKIKSIFIWALVIFLGIESSLLIWLAIWPKTADVKLLVFLIVNVLLILTAEVGFNCAYFLLKKKWYQRLPKVDFSKMYYEPHPYLPYVSKPFSHRHKSAKTGYPLNLQKNYTFAELRTNNWGFVDGLKGDRPVELKKPNGQIRIMCLGGSTTMNYVCEGDQIFSYPIELEKYLQKKIPGQDIVVHNCGHGGWNSADILVAFLLKIIDAKPDVIVIYHGYNDLGISLTPNFISDYSHARCNLGEKYYLYKIASWIPDFPLSIYNVFLRIVFPYMNPRFGILDAVARGKPDLSGDYQGLPTYRRNLEHIINVCQAHGVKVVLGTFAHYLYQEIKNNPVNLKYLDGIKKENQEVVALAQKYNLPVVDQFNLIPKEERYFLDSVHFSPEGMKLMAENFGDAIVPLIVSKTKK